MRDSAQLRTDIIAIRDAMERLKPSNQVIIVDMTRDLYDKLKGEPMPDPTPHTPGPWNVERRMDERGTSYGIRGEPPNHWIIPPLFMEPNNARLISAAPELLEALADLLLTHGFRCTGPCNCGACGAARAAIRKATGK